MERKLSACLAMSLLVSAAPALADDREFSQTELAACVAISEAQEIVIDARYSRKVWIDDIRPRADTEREREALNEHVEAFNELNRLVGKFDDVWNANCKGTLSYSLYEKVCKIPTDRMERFLKDGEGCAHWAELFEE